MISHQEEVEAHMRGMSASVATERPSGVEDSRELCLDSQQSVVS